MKKLFASMCLLFFCLASTGFAFGETVTISTGEWSPWAGKDLPKNGFVLHVVKEAFQNSGYDVEYKFYPWKRAYIMLERGNVQASAYWYPSEKRKEKCYYSNKLTEEKVVFFHKKSTSLNDWKTLEDLKEYKIGVTRGNTYTDKFWKLGDKGVLNFDVANTNLINFKKLVNDRVDIFPNPLIMGQKILQDNFSQDVAESIVSNNKPLRSTTGHLIFSKSRDDAEKLLQAFNSGLQQLKESGLYDTYLQDLIAGQYD